MTNDRRPRTRLDRRIAIIVVGAVAVSAAIAFLVWAWRSAEAAAGVQVIAGPGPINCEDGPISLRTAEQYSEPAIVVRLEAKPGAWCQVPISVRNTGPHTVTIDDLTFPAMREDKEGNHGALIATGDASGVPPRGTELSNDAIFDVGETIPAGETWTTLIRVEVNPYACNDAGVWSVFDAPQVHLTALHREHRVAGTIELAAAIDDEGLFWSGCAT